MYKNVDSKSLHYIFEQEPTNMTKNTLSCMTLDVVTIGSFGWTLNMLHSFIILSIVHYIYVRL